MADHVFDGDHTFDSEFALAAGDTLLVTENSRITIDSPGANNFWSGGNKIGPVNILGSVVNLSGPAVYFGGGFTTLTIGAKGAIFGGHDVDERPSAVTLRGSGNILINHGTVSGYEAIDTSQATGGTGTYIYNSGQVTATGTGILAGGTTQIVNSGTLEAKTGVKFQNDGVNSAVITFINSGIVKADTVITLHTKVSAVIVNSGHMEGILDLGNDFDHYDGRLGSATGLINFKGGNDIGVGGSGREQFVGGQGNDTFNGGGGNDIASYTGTRIQYDITTSNGMTTIADKIVNRDGVDQLRNVRFAKFGNGETIALHNADPTALSLSTLTVAETALVNTPVVTLSAHDADGDALTYSLNDPSGTFKLEGTTLRLVQGLDHETQARERTITVTAKDAYGGASSQTFTLSIANVIEEIGLTFNGTPGADAFTGENGADVIFGHAGNDVLGGLGGNDRIAGGAGRDVLSGGTGQDVFLFDTGLGRSKSAQRANLDTLTDFARVDDTIQLAKSVFTKIAKKGMLAKSAFYASTQSEAHDASDRIVYNKKTGALYYDQDGSGSKAAIQIATLSNKATLTHADFVVI